MCPSTGDFIREKAQVHEINRFKKMILLVFLWTGHVLCAPSITHTYHLSSYTIHTEIAKDGNTINIRYSPYEKYKFHAWEHSRTEQASHALGPRPYWDKPLKEILPEWKAAPDLTGEVFSISLSAESEKGWHRLSLADDIVLAFLFYHDLFDFVKGNLDKLKMLVQQLESEIGKPIAYFQYSDASARKKDQYILLQAVKVLEDKSSYFDRKKFEPWVKDLQSLNRIPASITKLSTSSTAIKEHALLVVHGNYRYDAKGLAKNGIDQYVSLFKNQRRPVIFLMDYAEDSDLFWYTQDRNPSFAVFSAGGEHNLRLETNELTIVGGFFGDYDTHHGCHFAALVDAISRRFLYSQQTLKIHFPVSAVFPYEEELALFKNFLGGLISDEEFIKSVHDQLFFSEDSAYLGTSNGISGTLSTDDYRFEYFVGEKNIFSYGTGKRVVEFRFSK
ncbi:MAG: hypothetical protein HY537_18915 [Deltaproteobacteria bacterium]|nr:hypothetical protein [Deltaproteobacteria bacterium]